MNETSSKNNRTEAYPHSEQERAEEERRFLLEQREVHIIAVASYNRRLGIKKCPQCGKPLDKHAS